MSSSVVDASVPSSLTPSSPACLQAEALDLQKTVLQTVEEVAEGWKMNDIKALLGRWVGTTTE